MGTIDGAPMLYERHLATQIMLWLVLVYVSWCVVIATRKQRAPAMTETIGHVFGDHTRHCNTHKYILREVPVGLYIVSYRKEHNLSLQQHLQNMLFSPKCFRGRKTSRPFVACARKAALLRGHMWSAHDNDVVRIEVKECMTRCYLQE